MPIIVVPKYVQKELSDMVRVHDPLPGAKYADIRVNRQDGGWLWCIAPICWLPWNRPHRVKNK